MIEIKWTKLAADDLAYWKKHNLSIYNKIKLLIKNIQQTPFKGIGKPELLKYSLSNLWSRRITKEHKLVYGIKGKTIIIYQCRFHY
jgi:toxin YoeB